MIRASKVRLKRARKPFVTKVVEIVRPGVFYLYHDVASAADAFLEGREPQRELRWLGESGCLFCARSGA